MLILTQRGQAGVRELVEGGLLDLLKEGAGEGVSQQRLRALRYLVATLNQLVGKGKDELKEYVGEGEMKVLEKCTRMEDESIQMDSRRVLERLAY
jgi:hypothetical protein